MGDDREVARTGATQVPTHAHQLKGGCSVAPPQVDRKGQPYYTRCDAAHRTRGWWGAVYSRVDPGGQPGGSGVGNLKLVRI